MVIVYVATLAALASCDSIPFLSATPTPTPFSLSSSPLAPPSVTAPNDATLQGLRLHALDLINEDRRKQGVAPVQLADDASAQQHAEDMLRNFYLAHWDTGGMKPYMRYTIAGGTGAVAENVAYSGTQDPNDIDRYRRLDPKETIAKLEYLMVYDDADSNWGHRDTILNSQHQYVSIGVAYTDTRLAMVQHFENRYVTFTSAPTIQSGVLSLAGSVDAAAGDIKSVDLYYAPPPQTLTHDELLAKPHSYKVGDGETPAVHILPPPPRGFRYTDLGPTDVIAGVWSQSNSTFDIQAQVGRLVSAPGVYTVLLWAEGMKSPLTTISLFVE